MEHQNSVEISPYYYFQQQGAGGLPHQPPLIGLDGTRVHQPAAQPFPAEPLRQRRPPPINQVSMGALQINPAGNNFAFDPASRQQQPPRADARRKEVNRYDLPFDIYSIGWSVRSDSHLRFRLAIASFIEEYCNKVSILQLHEERGDFFQLATFDHPYIPTKIVWIPDPKGNYPDLLATTGDYLRLWRVGGQHGASLEILLNNVNRSAEYCAPLTSADWNEVDPTLLGTSSIDTTCTIWQIETGQALSTTERASGTVKTQLIAHDKEVFDLEFAKLGSGRDIFASAGADGSIRMFDLRHMEYSTIVFEEPSRQPLLRLAWNRQDHNYLATFALNSKDVHVLDIRVPSLPVATLRNHTAPVNGIAWAPHSTCHICTVGEDCQALIWDCHQIPRPVEDPILAYTASGRINQVNWSEAHTDWISICYDRSLELLRV